MTKMIRTWFSRKLGHRDPVQRLTRTQLEARADMIANDWLKVSRDEAFAKLERGELAGTLAEPELISIRDMLAA